LAKPPSFVGKYETCERRLDVIEFLVLLRTLNSSLEEFQRETKVQVPVSL